MGIFFSTPLKEFQEPFIRDADVTDLIYDIIKKINILYPNSQNTQNTKSRVLFSGKIIYNILMIAIQKFGFVFEDDDMEYILDYEIYTVFVKPSDKKINEEEWFRLWDLLMKDITLLERNIENITVNHVYMINDLINYVEKMYLEARNPSSQKRR